MNIEETRIYKDLERQTKLKAAERLLSMGYSIEKVARCRRIYVIRQKNSDLTVFS